jgi:hypothetical protein
MANIRDHDAWSDGLARVVQCLRILANGARGAQVEELRRVAIDLIPTLAVTDPEVAGKTAITLGAFIEFGLPPRVVAADLLKGFERTLELLKAFKDRVRQEVPEPTEEPQEEAGGYWVDERYVGPELAEEFWRQDRRLPQANASMGTWYPPVVAALARDREVLQQAQQNKRLLELVTELDITYVGMLLRLLVRETLLVLHPGTAKGFWVLIDGVADNFQLHTLLADSLIAERGFLRRKGPAWGIPGKRPSPKVAATMRGDGPPSIETPSMGVWNLYNWTALGEDGRLPESMDSTHWIWNEGVPADIRPFEGQRVVLLGPPSYPRSWNTARVIPPLKPTVEVQQVLEEREVSNWLRRLAAARRPASGDH